jgi:hypothetical protein
MPQPSEELHRHVPAQKENAVSDNNDPPVTLAMEKERLRALVAAVEAERARLPATPRRFEEPSADELRRLQQAAFGAERISSPESARLVEEALAIEQAAALARGWGHPRGRRR